MAATRGAVGPEQAPDETEADFDGDCELHDVVILPPTSQVRCRGRRASLGAETIRAACRSVIACAPARLPAGPR